MEVIMYLYLKYQVNIIYAFITAYLIDTFGKNNVTSKHESNKIKSTKQNFENACRELLFLV